MTSSRIQVVGAIGSYRHRCALFAFWWNSDHVFTTVLQSMLYRYASFLLSRHCSALLPGAYQWDDELYEMIKYDFLQPVSKVAGEDATAEPGVWEVEWMEIIEHFYKLTHEIAHEFRSRFGQAVAFIPLGVSADAKLPPGACSAAFRCG